MSVIAAQMLDENVRIFKSVYSKCGALILPLWDFSVGLLSALGATVSQGGEDRLGGCVSLRTLRNQGHLGSASMLVVLCVLCHMHNLINSGMRLLSTCFNTFHNTSKYMALFEFEFMVIKHIHFSPQRVALKKYLACPTSASLPTGHDTNSRAPRMGRGTKTFRGTGLHCVLCLGC